MAGSRRMSASLTVTSGSDTGEQFDVLVPVTIIGRHQGCQVQVDDPQVSRRHAYITWNGKEYILEDLGSSNGTFANGERLVRAHALQTGDVLQLGPDTEIVFRLGPPVRERKAPAPVADSATLVQNASLGRNYDSAWPGRGTWVLPALLALIFTVIVGGGFYLYSRGDLKSASSEPGGQRDEPGQQTTVVEGELAIDELPVYPGAQRDEQAEADWAKYGQLSDEQALAQVRFYSSPSPPDQVLSYYVEWMEDSGWQTVEGGSDAMGGEYLWKWSQDGTGTRQARVSVYLDTASRDKTWIMVEHTSDGK